MDDRNEFTDRPELVKKRARNILLQRLMIALAGLIVFSLLLGTFITVYTGAQTRGTLLDCVEPGGQCFKEGQDRTGDYIGDINKISVLAAACAQDPAVIGEPRMAVRIKLTQECVENGLEKQND